MRMLILGAFNEGALENYYLKGLRQAGADCATFDITKDYYSALNRSMINKAINKIRPDLFFKKINRSLLSFLKDKHFDVILVFKGMTLFVDTVRKLKSHARMVCCYNPDHPFKFFSEGSGNHHITDSIEHYNIYFTYSRKICEQLKKDRKVESFVIPFGYDNYASSNSWSLNPVYENKCLFIGTWDKERMKWLDKMDEPSLQIYGDNNWNRRTGNNLFLQTVYQGRPLYGAEYREAIQNAYGVINLLRKQNLVEGSHNMRTFEVPGYGGVLISNRTEEQQAYFEEDKEAVYFDGQEELNDKVHYLVTHGSVVDKIRQAAKSRSEKSGYGYSYRSRELYQILSEHL